MNRRTLLSRMMAALGVAAVPAAARPRPVVLPGVSITQQVLEDAERILNKAATQTPAFQDGDRFGYTLDVETMEEEPPRSEWLSA